MACGGMGGCNDNNSFKSSNHAPKKMPNWGMTKKPGTTMQAPRAGTGGFGTPKVKMSFGRKR